MPGPYRAASTVVAMDSEHHHEPVLAWLLAGDAAVRWQVERDLLHGSEDRWLATRTTVVERGWVADLLQRQDASGTWGGGGAFALAVFDAGRGAALFAGGVSIDHEGNGRPIVARWDGVAWHEIGTLAHPTSTYAVVVALAVFDDGSGPALFASGSFENADGLLVNHIARWDGAGWGPLAGSSGVGLEHSANALAAFDDVSGAAL